jgi:tetratricopeptide (TPR) repeat protein
MRKATSFTHFDQLHLKAAESWLQFGNWREATEELEQLQLELRTHPEVLELHFKIYSEANRWDKAVEVARTLSQVWPENEWGHFHLAFALHQLRRIPEAYETTIRVVNLFPANYLMRYNLACYACRLGRFTEALTWLEDAVDLAGEIDIRAMAAEDSDLRPLWGELGEA